MDSDDFSYRRETSTEAVQRIMARLDLHSSDNELDAARDARYAANARKVHEYFAARETRPLEQRLGYTMVSGTRYSAGDDGGEG